VVRGCRGAGGGGGGASSVGASITGIAGGGGPGVRATPRVGTGGGVLTTARPGYARAVRVSASSSGRMVPPAAWAAL
jgi:hypothetical protein